MTQRVSKSPKGPAHAWCPIDQLEQPWTDKFTESWDEAADFVRVPNSEPPQPSTVELIMTSNNPLKLVEVGGTFNGWDFLTMHAHSASDNKYVYSYKLHGLAAGVYQYKYRVNGDEYICDESQATELDSNGNRNNVLIVTCPIEPDVLYLQRLPIGYDTEQLNQPPAPVLPLRLESSLYMTTDKPQISDNQEEQIGENPKPPVGYTIGGFVFGCDGSNDSDGEEMTRELSREAASKETDPEIPHSAFENMLRPSSGIGIPSPFLLPELAYHHTALSAVRAQKEREAVESQRNKENAKFAFHPAAEAKFQEDSIDATMDDQNASLIPKRGSVNAEKDDENRQRTPKRSPVNTTKSGEHEPLTLTRLFDSTTKFSEEGPLVPERSSSKNSSEETQPLVPKTPYLHKVWPVVLKRGNEVEAYSAATSPTPKRKMFSYDGCFDNKDDEDEKSDEMRPTPHGRAHNEDDQRPRASQEPKASQEARASEDRVEPFPSADGTMDMTAEEYQAQMVRQEAEVQKPKESKMVSFLTKIFLCGASRVALTDF